MSSLHLLYQVSTSLSPSFPIVKLTKNEKEKEEYKLIIDIYTEMFKETGKKYKIYFNPMFSFQKNIKKILSRGLENGKKIESIRHSFENILFDIVSHKGIDSPVYVMLRTWFIPYFSRHMKYYEEYVREIYRNVLTITLRSKEKAKIRDIYDKCCVYGYYPFIKEYQDLLAKK